jgi:hypothetical protein
LLIKGKEASLQFFSGAGNFLVDIFVARGFNSEYVRKYTNWRLTKNQGKTVEMALPDRLPRNQRREDLESSAGSQTPRSKARCVNESAIVVSAGFV